MSENDGLSRGPLDQQLNITSDLLRVKYKNYIYLLCIYINCVLIRFYNNLFTTPIEP